MLDVRLRRGVAVKVIEGWAKNDRVNASFAQSQADLNINNTREWSFWNKLSDEFTDRAKYLSSIAKIIDEVRRYEDAPKA